MVDICRADADHDESRSALLEEDLIYGTSADQAREQLRLANEAFLAIGGERPDKPVSDDEPVVTCEILYQGAAILTWFAAQAALQDLDYTPYLEGADYLEAAAHAQGCD